jgi:hypothetical protein
MMDRRTLISAIALATVCARSGAFAQQHRSWRVGFVALPERPSRSKAAASARSRWACANSVVRIHGESWTISGHTAGALSTAGGGVRPPD